MPNTPETISTIRIGNEEFPIDAVTVNGRTLPDESRYMPTVSAFEDGKILMVLNGQWGLSDPGDLYENINGIDCGDPEPDIVYEESYLTLDILEDGTVKWNAFDLENTGSPLIKTIQYSINDGEWVTATSSTSGVTINVSTGDKVRLKGTNNTYATTNKLYSGFGGNSNGASTGTASFNVYGNAMSLIYGDNFIGQTTFPSGSSYNFCCLFDGANVISAEHLILPAMTLRGHCYRAMFANCSTMIAAPELPATTLSASCYRYMFQYCSFTTAPELPALVVPDSAYYGLFSGCSNLNYIKCMARDISAHSATLQWTQGVAATGTFVKDVNMNDWPTNSINGIPTGWTVVMEGELITVTSPTITFENNTIAITCAESGTEIFYRLGTSGDFSVYSTPIAITENTTVQAYSRKSYVKSSTVSQTCQYVAPVSVAEPVISYSNNIITITCSTTGAAIYYKLGENGEYQEYTAPIEINENVTVYTYASLSSTNSTTVSESCQYVAPVIPDPGESEDSDSSDYGDSDSEGSEIPPEPPHDYSLDYLTLDILTSGTVMWKADGSNATKTVSYSINDGAWTDITSTSGGVTFNVTAGDSVRLKGSNTQYCNANKSNYSHFGGTSSSNGTATYNISGNIMSLVAGDNFTGVTTLPGTWTFCQLFKYSKAVSAENLILPASTMTECCYRAMFSYAELLEKAPALPATTLANDCYWYMFEHTSITKAPDLLASTLMKECYGYMFNYCPNLNYIKCMATTKSATDCLKGWVTNVAASGTFVKDSNTSWSTGASGIPTGWTVFNNEMVENPVITFNGEDRITITCNTTGVDIYYRLGTTGSYSLYSGTIFINDDTTVYAYASKGGQQSNTVSESCTYSEHIYTFDGLQFSSGPLYYGSNGYEIKDSWNYDSYNSVYGKSTGSYYFNFLEMGELFEKSGFTTSDGDIENNLDPFNGWRLPSKDEWDELIGTTRTGSTVNNSSGKHYARIQLTGITYAGSSTPNGLLIFPDGETITGTTLTNMDNNTVNTGITISQLNEYLNQGCIFLPAGGYYSSGWSSGSSYGASTEYDTTNGYNSEGYGSKSEYLLVRLVRNNTYGDETPLEGANKDINNWVI